MSWEQDSDDSESGVRILFGAQYHTDQAGVCTLNPLNIFLFVSR